MAVRISSRPIVTCDVDEDFEMMLNASVLESRRAIEDEVPKKEFTARWYLREAEWMNAGQRNWNRKPRRP